ncbi:glycosyltransferase family 2 protein [Parabacteroides massiliensis]|jgi:rhamnopyranosyl-N-acetylglucosaminyl-diphospho-decaprenol beta-1,3/1,4-galactofuranosyltransferase|uniref:glycosyltransferase family 2 protein n=1 Tax=Parabacteroides massiliensis TaxID=1750560 RepID=UPI00096A5336|nr:glycosyltransferase family 2 protein [Parabacteroides massiliensis]
MIIYAFIVTYNRLDLLKKTIACLQHQSHPIDKLFIVNNGSTDGTAEWLSAQPDLQVIHQQNIGGAGGFSTGVQHAYMEGADWIWMMDDDVFPAPDCLETLLKYSNRSLCLHPARYYSDDVYVPWGYQYDIRKDKETKISPENFGKEIFSVNVGCFEGMLIHRSIIDKIGFPDKRFFITSDDRIYGYLASLHTDVTLVRDAKLKRQALSYETKNNPMYTYYVIRNFHLRNEYCRRLSGDKGFTFWTKVRFALGLLKSYTYRYSHLEKPLRQKMRKAVRKGTIDCLKKKTGNTFAI